MNPTIRAVLVLAIGAWFSACVPESPKTVAEVVEQDASGYEQLLKLGLAFAEHQDNDRAEQYLAAALERGADPNVALGPLLHSCTRARRYQSAIEHAEAYREQVQARRETEMILATLYLALGQDERAEEHLAYVVEHYSEYPLSHFLFGRLLLERGGDPARADQHFREYLRLEPNGIYMAKARSGLLKLPAEAEALPSVPVETHLPDTSN